MNGDYNDACNKHTYETPGTLKFGSTKFLRLENVSNHLTIFTIIKQNKFLHRFHIAQSPLSLKKSWIDMFIPHCTLKNYFLDQLKFYHRT